MTDFASMGATGGITGRRMGLILPVACDIGSGSRTITVGGRDGSSGAWFVPMV
ncbi:hypothetical protein CPE01_02450 [Cellulomonas persica]|uniref:Uncharacterized protein n=1 Tax=Cellulomonas persica TaxID=76861 RepID=A0A510UPC5_9CELL|nr:hypothetical protein CPE01_02450 [Cellulomonas persica]